MYIWRLEPILAAEGTVENVVDKASERSYPRFG
jgi:hypothetical protein